MLEVLSKFICSLIMCTTGFYIIKTIIKSDEKLLTIRNSLLLLLLIIIQLVVHKTTYEVSSTLITFCINMLLYKIIFKMTYEEALICCGIYTIILFFTDIVVSGINLSLFTVEEIRTNPAISIVSNIIISILSLTIAHIKVINNKIRQFLNFSRSKKQIVNTIFIILLVACFICLGFNVTTTKSYDIEYMINFSVMVILAIIAYIYIKGKINYYQLSDEYDTLFSYVQNFEDWIEKEQLNRHEYKNQLAVLRSLTKEEKLINKINEILDDNINIKGDVVHKLKELPKGGLKGLMYYKVAIAQKQKLNIEVDVSLKNRCVLNKLSEAQIKVLCNLIGIYFDNAIEAAVETKKKTLSLEVYDLKDKTKIVISNTFNQSKDFDRRNERGVTTKGKGHGNGLYYASNLISKNKWLESTQEVIDDYYIQTLIIKRLA